MEFHRRVFPGDVRKTVLKCKNMILNIFSSQFSVSEILVEAVAVGADVGSQCVDGEDERVV